MTSQLPNIKFNQSQIDKIFEALTSFDAELKKHFDNYILDNNKNDLTERLYYLDIAEIARFIVDKEKNGQTDFFQHFFNQIESILTNCDKYVDNLIVVGLFESIQNICTSGMDYHLNFDKWLQPISKQKWENLIDSWEGKDWRNKKE
jgi:hypothetical protein